jgi:hypothetical protein
MWEKVEAKLIMDVLEFERYMTLALFRSTDHPVSTWCVGTRLVARKVHELEEKYVMLLALKEQDMTLSEPLRLF